MGGATDGGDGGVRLSEASANSASSEEIGSGTSCSERLGLGFGNW